MTSTTERPIGQWPRPRRAFSPPRITETDRPSDADGRACSPAVAAWLGADRAVAVTTPPELLITVVPADVAMVLLVKAGLDEYRRAHRGEDGRVDRVLIELTTAAIRWRELTANGQSRAPNADTGPPSQKLTTRQVADLTGVSDRTIRRYIAEGHIPADRVGSFYLVNRDDVDHYRATRTA